MLKYDKALGSDSWRLARVACALPDSDGLVRTIKVQFRPRHVRDRGKKYRAKLPLEMEIGVAEVCGHASSGRTGVWSQSRQGVRACRGGLLPSASVRDDGKLGGLGHATLGRSSVLPCGSPSPPLLHEVKLSGLVTGGR